MSQIKKINKRMEITPQPERLGGVIPAELNDEAVTLGQLREYGSAVTKRVYKANLTQASTNAPTATVLENTCGNVVFSYSSTGLYLGTLTGIFPDVTKCTFFIMKQFINSDTGGIYVPREFSLGYNNANSFYIQSYASGIPADDVLSNTTILIEVYN